MFWEQVSGDTHINENNSFQLDKKEFIFILI
jgi:hypothetical protein